MRVGPFGPDWTRFVGPAHRGSRDGRFLALRAKKLRSAATRPSSNRGPGSAGSVFGHYGAKKLGCGQPRFFGPYGAKKARVPEDSAGSVFDPFGAKKLACGSAGSVF